jgi:Na+-driven multidrug efflux pump
MGIDGPPLAMTLSNLNGFVTTWIYIEMLAKKDLKIRQAWFLPGKSSFQLKGLVDFMKLGLPSVC